jgi:hypothetical protein
MASRVLVLTTDLLAIGRIEAAARAAGWSISVVRPDVDPSSAGDADLIVVDLDALGPGAVPAFAPTADVVGFFSHVDKDLGEAAARAGIDVFPRGRFWRELPRLLEELGQ